jgi:hypothetical protein
LGSTTQPSANIGSGTTYQPVSFNQAIGNTAQTYYFRAVASNPGGLTRGSTLLIYGGAPQ